MIKELYVFCFTIVFFRLMCDGADIDPNSSSTTMTKSKSFLSWAIAIITEEKKSNNKDSLFIGLLYI